MDEQYHDIGNPASFGGVDKLRRATKNSKKKTLEFLQGSDTYTLYKPIRHRFTRRKTIAHHKNEWGTSGKNTHLSPKGVVLRKTICSSKKFSARGVPYACSCACSGKRHPTAAT